MSEKLDKFAQDLLNKTREGKLTWLIHANPYGERYFVEIDEGYQFDLLQVVSGDSRAVTLRLSHGGRPALESVANNWPRAAGGIPAGEAVSRFRLYSDLFDAVRESVYGKEETLGKVEELLRKIG